MSRSCGVRAEEGCLAAGRGHELGAGIPGRAG